MPSILERLNSGQQSTPSDPQHQTGEKPATSPLGARRVAPFIASGNF